MKLLFLCAVFLVLPSQMQGCSAVTPVFVQKGKDITLDVMTDGFHEDDVIFWSFNTSSVIVRFLPGKEPSVSEVYTGRVEFPQKKYSVTLKNLQESDSGVYTGRLIGNKEQILAGYTIAVQAPVSPVKLTVDSVSSSSDSCNLTVTCSTQDSDITSRVTCDTTTCHQEGGESSKVTTSGASLRLYLVNSTINCNHSNQVSWTNDTKETGQVCPQFTGSSAVTPVFVQKGKDVTLDVMKDDFHVDDIVLWRFNKNSIFVRFVPGKEPIVSEVYTGRVEFPQKKYSVTLKNLQESDSGVYTAQLIGSAEVQTVAEHKVTVQAPVSPVKLTVSSSSDSCNLTVTCSTQDSDITSRVTCDTITCHQEGGESSKVMTSGASLRLYLVNSMINCNHSNQVSWTKDTKETGQACLLPPDQQHRHVVIVPVLFGISVLILVFVLFLCYRRRRQWQYKPEAIDYAVYAVPRAQPSPHQPMMLGHHL
ncbi:uncharacterized protein LOC113134565 [Mastacembelus armatus]|uniref:uncharacterized protein LOC113134565 n=1 Tax=Mastacembelus armatus TaxID=205130 RepID=UPI000E45735A|nr:uncharacterized protein LOC113134565 [Mastacembelus armatus]